MDNKEPIPSHNGRWLISSQVLAADGLDNIAKLMKLKQQIDERCKKDVKPRVLVIGYGASGCAAASTLEEEGYSVVVVDAQERYGGRVRSTQFCGTVIDEGASFIHGTLGNPVADMFDESMTYSPDPDGYSMYDEHGAAVDPVLDKSVTKEFNQMLDMLDWIRERNGVQRASGEHGKRRRGGHFKRQVSTEEREVSVSNEVPSDDKKVKLKTFSEIPDTTNWSLEQGIKYYLDSTHKSSSVLRQLYSAVLQDRPRPNGARNNKTTISEDLRRQVFMWHVANIEAPCSAPVSSLSLHHWDQDDPHEFGGDHVMLINGYNQFFKFRQVSHVHYNVAVTKIERIEDEDTDCVRVSYEFTAEVSEHEQRRVAQALRSAFDAVIVTSSLGVLKRNLITFDPPLTERKVKSIKRLGFGVFNKMFISFKSVFWTKDIDKDYIMLVSPSQGLFYIVVNLYKMKKVPVLMAFIAGRAAQETEKLTDEAAVLSLCTHLSKIYGPVSEINGYKLTRWSTKPWIFGSYTYVSVAASGEDYDVLAEPHEDLVFFAGEHTNREHPATVAGAYESGVREAERVMDLTKKGILIRSKRSIRESLLCEAQSQLSAVLQNNKQFNVLFEAYLRDEADDEFSNMLHDLSFKIEDNQLYLCSGNKSRVTLNDIQQLLDANQWVTNKRRKLVTPRRLDVPQSVPVKVKPAPELTDHVKQEVNVVLRERVPIKEETNKPRRKTKVKRVSSDSEDDDSFEYASDEEEPEPEFKVRRRKTEIVH